MSDVPSTIPLPSTMPTDPVLREFLPEFVERWIADIDATWEPMRERNDQQELYRFGHTIKGSMLQFGLSPLADVGRAIMAASAEEDWDTAHKWTLALRDVLVRLQATL